MARRKTHDEYVLEVANINPNIEVVGTYVNSYTPILHRCKIDGCEWSPRPNSIIQGCGCPECGRLNASTKRTKTHEQYIAEVLKINPNIEVVGEYSGDGTPILHRCKIDAYEWMARPGNILQGQGCPRCAKCEKYGHDEYVNRVARVNKDIEVVGEYVNSRTKILHRCKICGHEWCATPYLILRGTGCPVCGINKRKRSHAQYVADVAKINPDIEVIGEYVNNDTKILHRCKIDGYEWYAKPKNILRGNGCPMCAGNMRYGHDGYVALVSKVNQDIDVVGTYINAHTPILHRCKTDGYEWMATPNNILRGTGCPKCNISKGEMAISKFLDDINVRYEQQKRFNDCRDKYTLPFDFYLPDYNVCIEYNGIQHYEPVEVFGGEEALQGTVKRDKIKEAYCNRNGIRLLQIPYYNDMHDELERLNALLMCG